MHKALILTALLLLYGCSEDPENSQYVLDKDITETSIRSISSEIESVGVYMQYAGEHKGLNNIDIFLNSGQIWGGAQDWNGVSITVFNLSKTLLLRNDIGKITFLVSSGTGEQWAKIEITKTMLPNNWKDLTYLEFFSYIKPIGINPDSLQWLNEFYSEYGSAVPK